MRDRAWATFLLHDLGELGISFGRFSDMFGHFERRRIYRKYMRRRTHPGQPCGNLMREIIDQSHHRRAGARILRFIAEKLRVKIGV